jgi:hypothetical protein
MLIKRRFALFFAFLLPAGAFAQFSWQAAASGL